MRLTVFTEVQEHSFDRHRVKKWIVMHNNHKLSYYNLVNGEVIELLHRVHWGVWDTGNGRGDKQLHKTIWTGGAIKAEGTGVREHAGCAMWHGRVAPRSDERISLPPPLIPAGVADDDSTSR